MGSSCGLLTEVERYMCGAMLGMYSNSLSHFRRTFRLYSRSSIAFLAFDDGECIKDSPYQHFISTGTLCLALYV